jgi:hypothetical protein
LRVCQCRNTAPRLVCYTASPTAVTEGWSGTVIGAEGAQPYGTAISACHISQSDTIVTSTARAIMATIKGRKGSTSLSGSPGKVTTLPTERKAKLSKAARVYAVVAVLLLCCLLAGFVLRSISRPARVPLRWNASEGSSTSAASRNSQAAKRGVGAVCNSFAR